jgi:hypothetical protein
MELSQEHLHVWGKCPRCIGGILIPDWRSIVCINCGFRLEDNYGLIERRHDKMLFWAIRNLPRESYSDPLKQNIYVGKRFVGTISSIEPDLSSLYPTVGPQAERIKITQFEKSE